MNDTNAATGATINGPATTTTADNTASKDATPSRKREPKAPALNFTSSMNFKDAVTDQDGKDIGVIKMTGPDTFEFVEVEGTNLTSAQHIAVGKRLAALEKAFGRLTLPN